MSKILPILFFVLFVGFGVYFISGLIDSKPPEPTITVNGKHVPSAQGTYCWAGFLNGKCVDMISPPDIIAHHDMKPVVVSPEAEIKINFKKEPEKDSIGVNSWKSNSETEAAELKGNILLAPKETGIYVYDVFARWEKGDSSAVFVIEVK
jgi:hypothetical protein